MRLFVIVGLLLFSQFASAKIVKFNCINEKTDSFDSGESLKTVRTLNVVANVIGKKVEPVSLHYRDYMEEFKPNTKPKTHELSDKEYTLVFDWQGFIKGGNLTIATRTPYTADHYGYFIVNLVTLKAVWNQSTLFAQDVELDCKSQK